MVNKIKRLYYKTLLKIVGVLAKINDFFGLFIDSCIARNNRYIEQSKKRRLGFNTLKTYIYTDRITIARKYVLQCDAIWITSEPMIGRRFEKRDIIYIDNKLSIDFINTIIMPCCINKPNIKYVG